MNVRIRRLHDDVPLPRYESGSAAAFDFSATADVVVEPGRVALVPTGLVIEVPDGMFLGIFARSSTPVKRGLMVANGVGVVDPDYCGPHDEIKVPVMNFTAAPVPVEPLAEKTVLFDSDDERWAGPGTAPDTLGPWAARLVIVES